MLYQDANYTAVTVRESPKGYDTSRLSHFLYKRLIVSGDAVNDNEKKLTIRILYFVGLQYSNKNKLLNLFSSESISPEQ
jgi:hypothetical protein